MSWSGEVNFFALRISWVAFAVRLEPSSVSTMALSWAFSSTYSCPLIILLWVNLFHLSRVLFQECVCNTGDLYHEAKISELLWTTDISAVSIYFYHLDRSTISSSCLCFREGWSSGTIGQRAAGRQCALRCAGGDREASCVQSTDRRKSSIL